MLRSVAVILLPEVSPFELSVACEVFGIDRTDTGGPSFDFVACAERPGVVRSKTGLVGVVVDHDLSVTETADLVLVPAYTEPAADGAVAVPPAVREALRRAHRRGAWVMSLCSGAFALGEAGLLDGRRCTTHWMHAAELARRFPAATVDPAVLYVEDDRVITSAGTAAGIDACLHLVRRELGAAAAAAIARRMVVPPHRDGGQAQYIDDPLPREAETLAPVLAWMQDNLAAELTVPELAKRSLLSERTFARRFRAETGTTPAAWIHRQRLLRAQALLEHSALGVEEIASTCGFGSAAALRHHFAKTLGTTPLAYRRAFVCPEDGAPVLSA